MPVMLKTLKFKPLSCSGCQFNESYAVIVKGIIQIINNKCELGAKDYKNCPISNVPKFLERQFITRKRDKRGKSF